MGLYIPSPTDEEPYKRQFLPRFACWRSLTYAGPTGLRNCNNWDVWVPMRPMGRTRLVPFGDGLAGPVGFPALRVRLPGVWLSVLLTRAGTSNGPYNGL